jgi:hypothetical protein
MKLFPYIFSQSVPEFCELILYPATLLKLFIVSRSFCWSFLGLLGIGSYHVQIGVV